MTPVGCAGGAVVGAPLRTSVGPVALCLDGCVKCLPCPMQGLKRFDWGMHVVDGPTNHTADS
eukprot:13234071-Alexandrium_andersonii.AAC.1